MFTDFRGNNFDAAPPGNTGWSSESQRAQNRPAGYVYLIEKYNLEVIPNWHQSAVSEIETGWSVIQEQSVQDTYPASWWVGENPFAHLRFALEQDGINLGILSAFFEKVDTTELANELKKEKKLPQNRIIWFLYEYLTNKKLNIDDITDASLPMIPVLNPHFYYCTNGTKISRQRVLNNLLGTNQFCPIIRRTDKLARMEALNLEKRCEEVAKSYPLPLLKRALTYLHKKETRSSFQIENLTPDTTRSGKFLQLLERAEQTDFCDKQLLIQVQNQIVDARFCDSDYRTEQNYVGQSVSHRKEIIHYICPRPEDLPKLMEGLIISHKIMKDGGVHPIVHAAAIAYGLVFMHPFNDGNGRIHRFLINNILSQHKFIPSGLTFPISAAILKDPSLYDRSLEAFSRPLIAITQYTLDNIGRMTVLNRTARAYRYIDMTPQAEALAHLVERTIEDELIEELDFLNRYDKIRVQLRDVIDMPEQKPELFIKLTLQNGGRLSAKKRQDYFKFLTDDELERMEKIIRENYEED